MRSELESFFGLAGFSIGIGGVVRVCQRAKIRQINRINIITRFTQKPQDKNQYLESNRGLPYFTKKRLIIKLSSGVAILHTKDKLVIKNGKFGLNIDKIIYTKKAKDNNKNIVIRQK